MKYEATHSSSAVQKLIAKRVEELAGRKSQRVIASEIGFKNSNMISMLKTGESKLALDRVVATARALEIDPVYLFKLALGQFFSDESHKEILGLMSSAVSENEMRLLKAVREATNNSDPDLSDAMREKLIALFASADA